SSNRSTAGSQPLRNGCVASVSAESGDSKNRSISSRSEDNRLKGSHTVVSGRCHFVSLIQILSTVRFLVFYLIDRIALRVPAANRASARRNRFIHSDLHRKTVPATARALCNNDTPYWVMRSQQWHVAVSPPA